MSCSSGWGTPRYSQQASTLRSQGWILHSLWRGLVDKVFKKLGLKLNKETTLKSFEQEFYKTIDGFGYEWRQVGNKIIVNLKKKNPQSYERDLYFDNWLSKLSLKLNKGKQTDWIFKYVKSHFKILKGSEIREVLADLALFVIFSCILCHLIFITFTLFGIVIDLLAIVYFIRSFLYSVSRILMDDQTLLSKKFGFKKTDIGMETSIYTILRVIKQSKYSTLLASVVILTLSILSLIYRNPPLIYVISVINLVGLLFALSHMVVQYYRNRIIHKNTNGLKPSLLAVVLASLFFVIYVMNYFIYFPPLALFSSFFLDLILLYSIPLFVWDLMKINQFRRWSNSI